MTVRGCRENREQRRGVSASLPACLRACVHIWGCARESVGSCKEAAKKRGGREGEIEE